LRAAFPSDAESKLVEALRESGKAIIALVAVNNEDIRRHILFSPVPTTPLSDGKGISLAALAVLLETQSQGIVSKLINEEYGSARNWDLTTAWYLVVQTITSISGSRKPAVSAFKMNMVWMKSLCYVAFPIAL